jgi:hypothetical protein
MFLPFHPLFFFYRKHLDTKQRRIEEAEIDENHHSEGDGTNKIRDTFNSVIAYIVYSKVLHGVWSTALGAKLSVNKLLPVTVAVLLSISMNISFLDCNTVQFVR